MKRDEAVRRVLRKLPESLRSLARDADIPHSTLVRIRQGQLGATPDVVRGLADALARRSDQYAQAEGLLRESLDEGGEHE